LTKPIVSGTASWLPDVRLVGQDLRQTEMNHVARAAHHPLANRSVLSTPSQMRRRDSTMFPNAAGLHPINGA